jgi:hypothetical protein
VAVALRQAFGTSRVRLHMGSEVRSLQVAGDGWNFSGLQGSESFSN